MWTVPSCRSLQRRPGLSVAGVRPGGVGVAPTGERIGGERIFALGVSLGGYAALYYGLHVGAAGVLSLAGATDLTRKQRQGKITITALVVALLATAINLGHSPESTTTPGMVALALSVVAVAIFLVAVILMVWRSDP
jgi:drug/metabolite transporter (DMT)-like permease